MRKNSKKYGTSEIRHCITDNNVWFKIKKDKNNRKTGISNQWEISSGTLFFLVCI